MSAGLAILLVGFLFAGLYLYKVTRDRWNWRRVARWSLISLGSLVGLVILGGVGLFVFYRVDNWPHKQTAYEDLYLGMTMAEVKYIKGIPSVVLDPPKYDAKFGGPLQLGVPTKALPEGKHVEDYFWWQYDSSGSRLDVDFDPKTKAINRIGCYSKAVLNCPLLLGLSDGSSENVVIEKLGKPSFEHIDGVAKEMEFANFGVWFYLEKQKVYYLGVKDYIVAN